MRMSLRLIWNAFLKLVEIYIPVVSFCVMFLAFIVEIFFRYVLRNPLTWPFEVTTIGFLWTVLFGAIYTMHRREHIVFSLLYDVMSLKTKRVIRIVGNAMVFLGLGVSVYPSYRYISFMHIQTTAVFHIPYSIIYSPFLLTLVMTMYYTGIDLVQDVRRTTVSNSIDTSTQHGGAGS